nr:hypothetical protein [Tanacetum cinerariifolium]
MPFTSAAPVLPVGHNARKRKTSHSNWKGKATKGKSDRGSKRKAEYEIAPTSDPKEAVCFYYNTTGHWKRSCPKYLKDLKDGKVKKGSHSGLFMIELQNTMTSDSWVLDTGCGTHICTVLQGLKESMRLKHGELNLVMGNRKIMPVKRIGEYELMLKSRVGIDLNNCCYSSEMTRNIISFHALFKDGYKFLFDNENGDILDESMDVGDDVNDKLSFAAKYFRRLLPQFSHLKYLNLSHCIKLRSINVLPPLIQVLKADYCPDLRMTDDLHRECKWLFKISLIYSGISDLYEVIGLAMCCRLHPPADKDNAIGDTYLRIIFESTKLCGGFNSEDFAITFSSWQDIPQCGVHVVYKDDIKLMTRTESWIPDHMEYGWTDHDGIFRDDLQHGKWSKPSFLCDTEDANVKYVRL